MGPSCPIRSTVILIRDAQIIAHPPERFSLPEGTEIMNPDGAVQTAPLITAHQAAREGIFFDDGDTKVQP